MIVIIEGINSFKNESKLKLFKQHILKRLCESVYAFLL